MKHLAELNVDELVVEARRSLINGDNQRSIDAFTLALEGGADPVEALVGRGVAYLKVRNLDSAIEDFTVALKHDSSNGRAYHFRGTARQLRGDNKEAVEDLTRAIELRPENGVALYIRGGAYAALGRDEEAGRDIQAALRMSEHEVQQFVDMLGIVRTGTDRWWAEQIGERRPTPMDLTEDQARTLRTWFEEEPCTVSGCN